MGVCRLAVDEVADAFHGRAQRTEPRLEVSLRLVDPSRAAGGGERVGEATGLGARRREPRRRGGSRREQRPAAPERDTKVESSRPQTRVARRSSSVCPTRPESHVATSRSWRSATAFQRPWRAACPRCTPTGLPPRAPPGRACRARPCARRARCPAPPGSAARPARREAGRAGLAQPVPWRCSSRRSRCPSVDGSRGARCRAQRVGEPGVVALRPLAVGTHRREDAVDEPHEVDVGPVDPEAVRLGGEGGRLRPRRRGPARPAPRAPCRRP